jgi:hypothetical protein
VIEFLTSVAAAPPPQVQAQMEAHGVIPPLRIYVES